jgi:hypothetical protein
MRLTFFFFSFFFLFIYFLRRAPFLLMHPKTGCIACGVQVCAPPASNEGLYGPSFFLFYLFLFFFFIFYYFLFSIFFAFLVTLN